MLRFVYLWILCFRSFIFFIFHLLYNLCKFKFRTWRHLRLVLWLLDILAFCFMSWSSAHFMPLAFCLSLQCFIYSMEKKRENSRNFTVSSALIQNVNICEQFLWSMRKIRENARQLAIMWGNHKKVQSLNFNESLPQKELNRVQGKKEVLVGNVLTIPQLRNQKGRQWKCQMA